MTTTAWLLTAGTLIAIAVIMYFGPKGWRTILSNLVGLTVAVLAIAVEDLGSLLPEEWAAYALAFSAVGNKFLRYLTTTPMFKRD